MSNPLIVSVTLIALVMVQLQNCGLSEATVTGLNKRGISALFPIQKAVFEPVMAGRDIIGRARTGSGKTLAFALPVIESLVEVGLPFQFTTCSCLHDFTRAVPSWKGQLL